MLVMLLLELLLLVLLLLLLVKKEADDAGWKMESIIASGPFYDDQSKHVCFGSMGGY
jgi:hypothetical protein